MILLTSTLKRNMIPKVIGIRYVPSAIGGVTRNQEQLISSRDIVNI
jgi:hypothetical protein